MACQGDRDIQGIARVMKAIKDGSDNMFGCLCRVAVGMSIPELQTRCRLARPGTRGSYHGTLLGATYRNQRLGHAGSPGSAAASTLQFTWTTLAHDLAFAFAQDMHTLQECHAQLVAGTNSDITMLVAGKVLAPYLPRAPT